MFKSLFNITKDVIDVVKAPLEIALDVTSAITKPIADAANEIVEDIKKDVVRESPTPEGEKETR